MDKAQALQGFWNQFLPAYDEGTVPDGAVLPYITYAASFGAWEDYIAMTASVWYHSTSWAGIEAKVQEINDYIGLSGRLVPYDGGAMWIQRATPFAQRMTDPDDMIRRYVLQITAEYLTQD